MKSLLSGCAAAQIVAGDEPFAHGFAADQVFLENAFETLWRDRAIPRSLRIHDEPRPSCADAKAAGFGPHGTQARLLDASFDKIPDTFPFLRRAAIRPDAQEQVAFRSGNARFVQSLLDGFVHGGTLESSATPGNPR
jgi:hypothetical protein